MRTKRGLKSHSTNQFHQDQLRQLEILAGEKLDEIIDYFNLRDSLRKAKKFYVGSCPVHGGDNNTACNIFHEGDIIGNWRCFTHGCHTHFHPTIIGLVRGIISHVKYGWSKNSDESKECSFKEAVNFLGQFCNSGDISKLDYDDSEFVQKKFTSQINKIYYPSLPDVVHKIPRETAIKTLAIPDKYFAARGYSESILKKYDIGLCTTPGKTMYMRATVPIYDDNHEFVIGCTGRSIFEKCPLCLSYHNPIESCPGEYDLWKYTKWRHNDGFRGEYHLYNYWFAKQYIEQSKTVLLVESPGNVWRLEEAGFHNSVATFGAHLTNGQRNIIDNSGALAIVVLTDPDLAGKKAAETIKRECGNTYNIYIPQWYNSDIGDTSIEQVKDKLNPILDKIKKDLML